MEDIKKQDIIDIKGMFNLWARKWYWFVISFVVCMSLAFLYTRIKKPVYAISSTISISTEDKSGLGGLSGGLSDLFGSSGYVDDEIFSVQSHTVLVEVARQLQINKEHYVKKGFLNTQFVYKDYPVDINVPAGVADTLSTSLIFKVDVAKNGKIEITGKDGFKEKICNVKADKFPVDVKTPYGNFVFNSTDSYKKGEKLSTKIILSGYEAVAEQLYKDIVFALPAKKAHVISLSLESPNTEYAVDVLNTIMDVYNKRNVENRNREGMQTLDFIDRRLVDISRDLSESEMEVERYKLDHKILDVGSEAGYQSSKRMQYEGQLTRAQFELEMLNMTRDFLRNPDNLKSLVPLSVADASTGALLKNYNELVMQRMTLAETARENNLALRQLDMQMDALRSNILGTIDRTITNQKSTIAEISSQLGIAQSKLGNVPVQEREYRDIKRRNSIREQLYMFLLQRREETQMMIANATPKGIIIDSAYALQEPVTMKKKMVLAIAFVLSLMLPAVLLELAQKFRTRFSTREELAAQTNLPILGEICTNRSHSNVVVSRNATTSIAELFRSLRVALPYVLSRQGEKIVLMTSTRSGEGKTFVTINLAEAIALSGKRVCVIGMDIRKPRLTPYLGLKPHKGVTDFILDANLTPESIIQHNPVGLDFDVIVAGPIPPNPSELLLSERIDDLFEDLRKNYDYVLVDSAPVGMVSDSMTISRVCDATVYVCRADYTTYTDIDFLNRLVREGRLKKTSIVLNATTSHTGYGYGYGEDKRNGGN